MSTNLSREGPLVYRLAGMFSSTKIYLISLYGVTGPRDTVSAESLETVKKVKSLAKGKIPISAGFGISQAEHVSSLLRAGADGAIVGSVLVRTVADHLNDPEAAPYYLKKLSRFSSKRLGNALLRIGRPEKGQAKEPSLIHCGMSEALFIPR